MHIEECLLPPLPYTTHAVENSKNTRTLQSPEEYAKNRLGNYSFLGKCSNSWQNLIVSKLRFTGAVPMTMHTVLADTVTNECSTVTDVRTSTLFLGLARWTENDFRHTRWFNVYLLEIKQ